MSVSAILVGAVGVSVQSGLTVLGVTPVGILCANSIFFSSNISALITIEYFSISKTRYTKVKDWVIVNTLLNERILKQLLIEKKVIRKHRN